MTTFNIDQIKEAITSVEAVDIKHWMMKQGFDTPLFIDFKKDTPTLTIINPPFPTASKKEGMLFRLERYTAYGQVEYKWHLIQILPT